MEKQKIPEDVIRLQLKVTDELLSLGIPSHLLGFVYLNEAITNLVQNGDLPSKVSSEVYDPIAEKFSTTPSRIERNIRHAIEVGFSRGNTKLLSEYFGFSTNPYKGKATNLEFISTVARRISLKKQLDDSLN